MFGMLGGVTGLKAALDKTIAAKSAALTYTRKDKGKQHFSTQNKTIFAMNTYKYNIFVMQQVGLQR